jgi:hypothetical protein
MGGNNPPQAENTGFGGDLLGFGASSPSPQQQQSVNNQQAPNNIYGGTDLMGFGFSNTPSNPPPNQGGFNFGAPIPQNNFNQPPQQQSNNFGFNSVGSQQPAQQPQTTVVAQSTLGFQPIVNNNPNKILAYDNTHLQIWIDCIKESNDATKLFTTYINKTNNTINEVTIQAAVLKHVKLTINPLSSTTLQPFSREVVHQVLDSLYRP